VKGSENIAIRSVAGSSRKRLPLGVQQLPQEIHETRLYEQIEQVAATTSIVHDQRTLLNPEQLRRESAET